ncbi:MAG: DmsE family decaheme c-type cytochrome [Bryobacteraceae bacterium]
MIILVLLAAVAVWAQEGTAQEPAATAAGSAAEPAASEPQYAGSEMCSACHEDIYKDFGRSPHQIVETDKRRGFEGQACESCHGPGGKHAESVDPADIRQPAKLPPAEADRTCLTCHRNQTTHVGRIQGGHARGQTGCVSCHSVHKKPARPKTAVAQNQLCNGCHTSQSAEFTRPHRHPVTQGAMSCLDCHNPHGRTMVNQPLRNNFNEPGCLRCHGDKRGPFAFEHAPMRVEGCTACHEPHGSANPRMLTRPQVRFLCLECHSGLGAVSTTPGGAPPAFHDLRSERYRNCTACHTKIHGSHVNRSLLR